MLKVVLFATFIALAGTPVVAGAGAHRPAQPQDCRPPRDNKVAPADLGATQCFPSPHGRKRAIVHGGRIRVADGGRTLAAGVIDYGSLAWNPASTGFAVADNAGSGQTSYFSYVDLGRSPLHRSKALRWAAVQRYAQRFKCKGPGVQVHAWFDGWQDSHHVRLVVMEGVHSEGCVHPDSEEIAIGVVGDPVTGRIDRVLTQARVRAEWCGPPRQAETGLCPVTAAP